SFELNLQCSSFELLNFHQWCQKQVMHHQWHSIKRKKLWIILGIIVAVVVIAAIVIPTTIVLTKRTKATTTIAITNRTSSTNAGI
ncbi:unnamed protein product, partial [Rotaria sp. Silwood1]